MARLLFKIKQNDTSRSIKFYPHANPASNFTGASVVFNMADKYGGVKISRAAGSIASDTGGTYFQYDWQAGDTDTAGDYEAEFEVTLSSGRIETYPNSQNIDVKIGKEIA